MTVNKPTHKTKNLNQNLVWICPIIFRMKVNQRTFLSAGYLKKCSKPQVNRTRKIWDFCNNPRWKWKKKVPIRKSCKWVWIMLKGLRFKIKWWTLIVSRGQMPNLLKKIHKLNQLKRNSSRRWLVKIKSSRKKCWGKTLLLDNFRRKINQGYLSKSHHFREKYFNSIT